MSTLDVTVHEPSGRPPRRPSLDDKYVARDGQVFMTGLQAIVRAMLDQRRADVDAGLRTAGFVSGYPGSPVATLDKEFVRARKHLEPLDVLHRLGVNEELALTAVYGSQIAPGLDGARYDGVIGMWYGKQPGLDRAHDALKHANYAGTLATSGAVAIVGDDPAAKSSSLPNGSEVAFYDALIPVLYPADTQDVLDLGRHAIGLSRCSGLWAGLKIVSNVADGSSDVDVDPTRIAPVLPVVTVDGRPYQHRVDGRLLPPYTTEMERLIHQARLEAARLYIVENRLNVVRGAREARLGIVAAGKPYSELMQALDDLGLDAERLDRLGVRILKLAVVWPLDGAEIRRFADGLEEILVVEDKRPFVERFLKEELYGLPDAPAILGKRDDRGETLLPVTGALEVDDIAQALVRRLRDRVDASLAASLDERVARIAASRARPIETDVPARTPYFCSGCPHNRGAQVPEGVLVGQGVGCHGMSMWMDPARFGDVLGLTQMGGEGAQWTGVAPFAETPHPVQNLGDGTFFHSGQLAVRAAIASGVTMTYKLLYNGTIAMTGGQDASGQMSVKDVVDVLRLEGVKRIVVTTEDPDRYRGVRLPSLATVRHRDDIVEAQRELAEVDGVTVLLHDQACAAELRRARKKGTAPEPTLRVLINERVCEGCGDCAVKSNCLSLQPVETDFGRKTAIHQASCNKDYSCLLGDCPSFVSVDIGRAPGRIARLIRRRRPPAAPSPLIGAGADPGVELPDPVPVVPVDDCRIRMTGVGGTGVVTVSQILAVAATLSGRHVAGLDQTGLAQKGGPVVSDLRISRAPIAGGNKVSAATCDAYLVFDALVGLAAKNLVVADPDRTVVVASTAITAPADGVARNIALPEIASVRRDFERASRRGAGVFVDAAEISERVFGDHMPANVVLLGAACQAGALPIEPGIVEQAIELNGAEVKSNLAAFRWGRAAVAFPDRVTELLAVPPATVPELPAGLGAEVDRYDDPELRATIATRVHELIAYQNRRLAVRYLEDVRAFHDALSGGPRREDLTRRFAWSLHKLMAYKDEYEVARLHLDAALDAQVAREFPDARRAVGFYLHPPALRALGLERKLRFGPWARPLLRALASAKALRQTPLDPFGRAHIRKVERALVGEFREASLDAVAASHPDPDVLAELLGLPDIVRGYEDVKLGTVETYRGRLTELLLALGAASPRWTTPTWPKGYERTDRRVAPAETLAASPEDELVGSGPGGELRR